MPLWTQARSSLQLDFPSHFINSVRALQLNPCWGEHNWISLVLLWVKTHCTLVDSWLVTSNAFLPTVKRRQGFGMKKSLCGAFYPITKKNKIFFQHCRMTCDLQCIFTLCIKTAMLRHEEIPLWCVFSQLQKEQDCFFSAFWNLTSIPTILF